MLRAVTLALLIPLLAVRAAAEPAVIFTPDKPFLFAYGSWDKKVSAANGRALIQGEGVTPKGGGGWFAPLDLSKRSAESPALRVLVGAGNRGKGLNLVLGDDKKRMGTWRFTLPLAGQEAVITPEGGASFSNPNSTDKTGAPDLAHIAEVQFGGDWGSDEKLDVAVIAVLATPADAGILAQRAAREKRDADEREQARRQLEALHAKYGTRTANSPELVGVSLVAPDVLAVSVQAGRVVPGKLEPYKPEPGDTRQEAKDDKGKVSQVKLSRGGQEIGWLIGAKRDTLVRYELFVGDPLLEDLAEAPATYTVTAAGDPAFAQGVKPTEVYHKSKPSDWAQPGKQLAMRHELYLKLPHALTAGKTYRLSFGGLNVRVPDATFTLQPAKTRSEAVHVSQIGYRPDDPAKRAFLSVWLGTGGVLRYPKGLRFSVLDDATGKAAFSGTVELAKDADDKEAMWRSDNFNKTSVYRMDFSALKTPGRYRVYVEGIGCSYPFEIGRGVWDHAFVIQMMGLLNQRSGIELGPPYTPFRKPRDFNPADGVKVYQSTHSVLDPGDEWQVAKYGTDKLVPEAWGGYHDAGDWNPRRVTHMRVTMAQLEVADLFPRHFADLKWSLPGDQKTPPVLREAQFELDCFRRLQMPDGAMRYGIETEADPIEGEVSWIQSMPAYVYAPDIWSSYIYAGVAARFAKVIAPYDAALGKQYRESALKAMEWAEADRTKRVAAGTWKGLRWEVKDDRNLAAVVLYDLTGDKHWHDVFLEDTCLKDPNARIFAWGDHVQRDAAFNYARLAPAKSDAALRETAVRGTEDEAKASLAYAAGNAFNLTTPDKGKPMFLGFYSTPDAIELVRAHYLTKKPEYLAGAVQACQFAAGANPNNMSYTVGLGANSVQHPLHLDSRRTGQPAPTGLTVFGNYDFVGWNSSGAVWPMTWYLGAACKPTAWDWPLSEAYFDIFMFPMQNEFVVDTWAPNVYVWGYLAARP